MKTFRVRAERPSQHWGLRDFRDLVVLDLGAGDFGRIGEANYQSTPAWWLDACGAKRVIAVDPELKDLLALDDDRIEGLCRWVISSDDIDELVRVYAPSVVKIDIEGAELHACTSGLPVSDLVRWVLVEAHSDELDAMLRDAFAEWCLLEVRELLHVPHACRVLVFENPRIA